MLNLTVHKKWFEKISSMQKNIEYREIKPYWTKRLLNKNFKYVCFKNGYRKDAPKITREFLGLEIGRFAGKLCYAIKLGKILSACNCNYSYHNNIKQSCSAIIPEHNMSGKCLGCQKEHKGY